jgi:glycosyltransferase involved in cell wall biosynthesis
MFLSTLRATIPMDRVIIAQRFVKPYRLPFFDALQQVLEADGIELRVVYGQPMAEELRKGDTPSFVREWGSEVRNSWLLGGRLLFQPLWQEARRADLVIVEQANLHLMNLPLLLGRRLGRYKFAFWGHGRNRQARKKGIGEHFKRFTLSWPDWWFAYTQGVADYLVGQGVSPHVVTAVQNSIDTTAFRSDLTNVADDLLDDMRRRLGLAADDPVGLYCGALNHYKRIDFLLEAAQYIKARLPGFRLIVLGGGPDAPMVAQLATREPWIHYTGPSFGRDKAAWFRLAHLFLIPGAVGLSIVDAFCAGLPLVTTSIPWHGPEIDYLQDGVNGLMTADDPVAFSAAAANLLLDQQRLAQLSRGARKSAEIYTLDAMVSNFREGIHQCLNAEAFQTSA